MPADAPDAAATGLPSPSSPELRRARPPRLPEVAEPELVRHITALADRTFGVDTGFYPLGSCTMKHNPRVNERVARLPGFRDLHPHQEDEGAQGALELMWRLQEILAEIAGLPAVTLQPAAGSQGELTGLMLMRAYFADRGEERDTIITADTAHGTNPASVTMAGYKLERVGTDARGNLDLEDLRGKVNERTAGLMLTNPSTLGLFDEGIEEVARDLPRRRRAPLLRRREPERRRRDLAARATWGSTSSTTTCTRRSRSRTEEAGPAAGPSRCARGSSRSCPPARRSGRRCLPARPDRPKSIGRVRGFAGPFGVFVRSYAFMRAYGPGLREMSEVAVLNANYLLARLRDVYDLPYDRLCMHEFVLSARNLKREHGITALDVAKRLMDYGIHPPTIYFPLVVSEALMIEPTETEPKERLDDFVDAMRAIAGRRRSRPRAEGGAARRPVRRLDEVRAAKQPVFDTNSASTWRALESASRIQCARSLDERALGGSQSSKRLPSGSTAQQAADAVEELDPLVDLDTPRPGAARASRPRSRTVKLIIALLRRRASSPGRRRNGAQTRVRLSGKIDVVSSSCTGTPRCSAYHAASASRVARAEEDAADPGHALPQRAEASCPHAASMSRPRVSRTVAGMRARSSTALNALDRLARRAVEASRSGCRG